jgi:hypothetical protein
MFAIINTQILMTPDKTLLFIFYKFLYFLFYLLNKQLQGLIKNNKNIILHSGLYHSH